MNSTAPLLPGWVVLPVAIVLLLVVATNLLILLSAPMPPSRRRIRIATGWLMLILVPLGAAAFGVVTPSDPRAFLMIWTLVIALLLILIVLSVLDVFNTGRLYRQEREKLKKEAESERNARERGSGDV